VRKACDACAVMVSYSTVLRLCSLSHLTYMWIIEYACYVWFSAVDRKVMTFPATRGQMILNNALKLNKEKGCHELLRRSIRHRTVSRRLLDYDPMTSTPKLARRVGLCHFNVLYVELLWIILYKYWLVPRLTLKNYAPKLYNVARGPKARR